MTTLADLMAEPDRVDFHSVRADFIRLEKTMNAKAYVDASFAWLVERSGRRPPRRVQSTHRLPHHSTRVVLAGSRRPGRTW
ncbi:hypothetical protein QP028_11465 [Corynebacterium suedekumii]|nr:hypothetical protein QP028_11465 [Corynebacterium suedekumii]